MNGYRPSIRLRRQCRGAPLPLTTGYVPMHAAEWSRLPGSFRLFARCLAVAVLGCLAAAPAWACNVPVFRYALERWEPDPYYLAVFHTGEDEAAARDVLATLEERPINVYAEAVNVDELDADDWRLAGIELDREKLPWAVLRYPPRGGQAPPVLWSGILDEQTLASLTNSSVRQEVVRRLLTGESAVWVLVESGDREKDEAARESLERVLAEAAGKLRIPGVEELDYSPTDPEAPPAAAPSFPAFEVAIPLKVEFSVISLSRDNASEQGFLAMLLNSEPDLHEYADDPMVFPMFGQGRALWALVGEGINAENIFESCIFLIGPCSCQIKHLNPGTDILMDFDWAGALEGRVPPPPEISPDMLTAVAPLLDEDEEAASAEPSAAGTVSVAVGEGDRPGGRAASHEMASAAPLPTTAPAGTDASDDGAQGVLAPVFVLTGAVLGGLLLVVAVATVVLLGKKKE